MRNIAIALCLGALALTMLTVAGCGGGVDELTVREIARDEAMKAVQAAKMDYTPEKFGFGVAWEDQFSYAQGVMTGNLIWVAGQLAHDTEVDENGMPKTDLMTGKNFEEQLRTTLDNIKKVLENYGATMDDVVFLQNFVDPEAGGLKAGDYNPVAARIISEYFPKGLHAMTFVEVVNLYGPQQLVESNAIAVVNK